MTYAETIDYLYNKLPMFSRKGGTALKKDLTNIKALCSALGNPQNCFKSIHIGGTNGKGSVCHLLAAVLQESGYKTGLHTSPHLKDFRERIRMNGEMAPQDFVVNFVEKNGKLIETVKPSFFEISVAMAFTYFAENDADIAVVEVGLGGRLDSTNILAPELSVITNIGLEHTQFLGDTRGKIAIEKAGIIKAQTPVVIGEEDEETKDAFVVKAQQMEAPLFFAEQKFKTLQAETFSGGQRISVKPAGVESPLSFTLDLGGYYQHQNLQTLLCSIAVLRENDWILPGKKVKRALANVKQLTGLRGRWEILNRHPLVIADTCHNAAGAQQVVEQLKALHYEHLFVVMGFVRDKDLRRILTLFPSEAEYFFCQAKNPRALSSEELQKMAGAAGLWGETYPSVFHALRAAKGKAGETDVVLVAGSTFVVAEIL